jgi:hypothetical protein
LRKACWRWRSESRRRKRKRSMAVNEENSREGRRGSSSSTGTCIAFDNLFSVF